MRKFVPGDIIRHFKREEFENKESKILEEEPNMYYYMFKRVAVHTETGEKLVMYEAMYPPFNTYARPYDMFMSEVDHEKYPDIKQKYRLEKIEDVEVIADVLKRYYDKIMN